jgi:hypothetical protein
MADTLDIKIDVEDMTIDEMEKLEEVTGTAFRNIDWDKMPTNVLRALAWVFGLRVDPSFTMEEAGKVRIVSLWKPAVEESDETDPTPSLSVNGVG